jgi:DNA-binding transcriptional regulator GbsR (MarR family)
MERLSPVQEKFILHWGEMGTRWGINRTVAQIHALLYLSPEPLHAEDIARLLSVARSNVSSSLRELQSWGIVRMAHVLGDRRDHFESLKDVWQMFQIIAEERKRREVDPTVAMLKACEAELKQNGLADRYTSERLAEMTDFFETTTGLYREVQRLPAGAIRQAAKLKNKLRKLLLGSAAAS